MEVKLNRPRPVDWSRESLEMTTQCRDEAHVPEKAARFLRLAQQDIQTSNMLPEALDESMPGVLEKQTLLSMTQYARKGSNPGLALL